MATICLYAKLAWFFHLKELRGGVLISIRAHTGYMEFLENHTNKHISHVTEHMDFSASSISSPTNSYRRQYAPNSYSYVGTYLRCFLGLRKKVFYWGQLGSYHFKEGKRTPRYTTWTTSTTVGSHQAFKGEDSGNIMGVSSEFHTHFY